MTPQTFARSLAALPDPTMRARALRAALIQANAQPRPEQGLPELAVWIQALATMLARCQSAPSETERRQLAIAADALADTLGCDDLDYDVRRAMYEHAVALGCRPLALMLFVPTPADAAQTAMLAKPERALGPRDRALSLGERKALARTPRRELLTLVAKDPHPDVVAIVLENPHLVEADVVRIAALRPTLPASLDCIAKHPRWRVRPAVRRALVYNPFTATATVVRLLPNLPAAELRDIAQTATLAPMISAHARQLLELRNPSRTAADTMGDNDRDTVRDN